MGRKDKNRIFDFRLSIFDSAPEPEVGRGGAASAIGRKRGRGITKLPNSKLQTPNTKLQRSSKFQAPWQRTEDVIGDDGRDRLTDGSQSVFWTDWAAREAV